jgi:hypothetical protein
MECNVCGEKFDISYNNVPWLTVEYCPFCGAEDVKGTHEEADDDVDA